MEDGDADTDATATRTRTPTPTVTRTTDADSDTDDKRTDTDTDTDPPGPSEFSLYDVQGGLVPDGTEIRTTEIVVTATAPLGFYAQERAGGASGGIWVHGGPDWEDTWPAAPGDRVVVVATYTEFFGLSELDLSGSANAEVTVVGVANLPDPEVLTLATPVAPPSWECF